MGKFRMPRADRSGLGAYVAIAGTVVALYYIFTTSAFPSVPAQLGAALQACIPGLLIGGFAIVEAILTRHGPAAMGGYTLAGLGLSIILDELFTAGVLTAAMLAPALLWQVQILVILMGFIMGIIAYRG